jgi:hypothetical protein
MVTACSFVGLSSSSTLVLSILFGLVNMLTALPGGLIFLLAGGRRMEDEELAAEAADENA